MSKKVLDILKAKFGDAIVETHAQFGDDTAVVKPEAWREVARFLRDDPRCSMSMFTDLCAVDYPDREPRFEVVCHLRSLQHAHRIRIKARVGHEDGTGAEIDSLVPVWRGADWFERETFDLMGITFVGHPDLRRILMYPEFVGHPLRKDYPAQRAQPLVAYREGNVEKLPPFGLDEGMSFGRQTHAQFRDEGAPRRGPASAPGTPASGTPASGEN
ncbi:MAG: NADH-quinone oxidoreductase subunit C [Byssovorax sp.]